MSSRKQVVVIGGGAAGFFCAINAASPAANYDVRIFEADQRTLAKVAISGGGRCNVTHHCFEIARLCENYPRGGKELRGPFTRFQPQDTVQWFSAHGVELKTEDDGRMFPKSDRSQTIIDALENAAAQRGVTVHTRAKVSRITRDGDQFTLEFQDRDAISCDIVVLATGGRGAGHKIAQLLGHTITPCAPSLFTFRIGHPLIRDLSGLGFDDTQVELLLPGTGKPFTQVGPLLITHWGLSGPAILKLSAWAARELAAAKYHGIVRINWLGKVAQRECVEHLKAARRQIARKSIVSNPQFDLTRRFWGRICESVELGDKRHYGDLSDDLIQNIARILTCSELPVNGKGEFKEEFVTCGGVTLAEVDFRTMESKQTKGVYFAGEVLDIDGITGGFNFQAAWTTGWTAGDAIRIRLAD